MDAVAARERPARGLMASFHSKDGYLYIDFRWRGLRYREATRLRDTTGNRTQVRRTVRQIDGEIAARTFDYLKWFPEGRRAALFAPPESVATPLSRDHVTKWLDDKQARLGAGTAYDWRRIVESRLIPDFRCPPRFGRFGKGPTKTVESKRDVGMLPIVEQALRAHRAARELRSPWIFANRDGGPLDITNLRERVWRPALRRAKLRARTLY
jgi:hypothetical protein